MLDCLLSIVQNEESGSYYFSDFSEALVYALIGFLIVFVGITLIIFIIWLIGLIMRKTDNLAFLGKIGHKKETETAETPEVPAAAEDEIPDEVKAAIVAAVMAYCEKSSPKCEFKVKRIKRI